jgi:hypothetical protein
MKAGASPSRCSSRRTSGPWALWQSVEHAGTAKACPACLTEYPKGQLSGVAKFLLAALSRPEGVSTSSSSSTALASADSVGPPLENGISRALPAMKIPLPVTSATEILANHRSLVLQAAMRPGIGWRLLLYRGVARNRTLESKSCVQHQEVVARTCRAHARFTCAHTRRLTPLLCNRGEACPGRTGEEKAWKRNARSARCEARHRFCGE